MPWNGSEWKRLDSFERGSASRRWPESRAYIGRQLLGRELEQSGVRGVRHAQRTGRPPKLEMSKRKYTAEEILTVLRHVEGSMANGNATTASVPGKRYL